MKPSGSICQRLRAWFTRGSASLHPFPPFPVPWPTGPGHLLPCTAATFNLGSNRLDCLIGRKFPVRHHPLPAGGLGGRWRWAPGGPCQAQAASPRLGPTASGPRPAPFREGQTSWEESLSWQLSGPLWLEAEGLVGRGDWYLVQLVLCVFTVPWNWPWLVAGSGFSDIINVILAECSGYILISENFSVLHH